MLGVADKFICKLVKSAPSQIGPKISQFGLKISQIGHTTILKSQIGPKTSQIGLRTSQIGPKVIFMKNPILVKIMLFAKNYKVINWELYFNINVPIKNNSLQNWDSFDASDNCY